MAISKLAKQVIERPLPVDKIKKRPGKGGLTFDYVTPDFVIDLLNEAFEYEWSTRIVSNAMHGDTAVVGLELTIPVADGRFICKQQFGSCDVGRGMGPGEAFKGAASDALKKAATLAGVALELYHDEEPVVGSFKAPAAAQRPAAEPISRPAPPQVAGSVPLPPRPVTIGPALKGTPAPSAHPTVPQRNPFDKKTASVVVDRPPVPVPVPQQPTQFAQHAAPVSRPHPFGNSTAPAGPNATQINALTNLAQRKDLSQSQMIGLAGCVDVTGVPKQSFEQLTHAEAIQVIKASQL